MHANDFDTDPGASSTSSPATTPETTDAGGALRVGYRPPTKMGGAARLSSGVLAMVRFGTQAGAGAVDPPGQGLDAQGRTELDPGPLVINVALELVQTPPIAELWQAHGPVRIGREQIIRYAYDDQRLFAVIEIDERAHGGILPAAEVAYAAIRDFQRHSDFPHLLRMWNYMDAINAGSGDTERYRQFCVGRARGLGNAGIGSYPAATAIGHQHATHQLQVFWLAGRTPGQAIENPRQVSAYHYPRVHGPVSPSFSRATMTADGTMLISGTASIVGHVSRHHDDASEQLEETVRNLTAVMTHAGRHQGSAAPNDLLKVYLRDPALAPAVAARLRELSPSSEAIFLAADICRRELLLEIEAVRQL